MKELISIEDFADLYASKPVKDVADILSEDRVDTLKGIFVLMRIQYRNFCIAAAEHANGDGFIFTNIKEDHIIRYDNFEELYLDFGGECICFGEMIEREAGPDNKVSSVCEMAENIHLMMSVPHKCLYITPNMCKEDNTLRFLSNLDFAKTIEEFGKELYTKSSEYQILLEKAKNNFAAEYYTADDYAGKILLLKQNRLSFNDVFNRKYLALGIVRHDCNIGLWGIGFETYTGVLIRDSVVGIIEPKDLPAWAVNMYKTAKDELFLSVRDWALELLCRYKDARTYAYENREEPTDKEKEARNLAGTYIKKQEAVWGENIFADVDFLIRVAE